MTASHQKAHQDPSMDQILASIREMISEEEGTKKEPAVEHGGLSMVVNNEEKEAVKVGTEASTEFAAALNDATEESTPNATDASDQKPPAAEEDILELTDVVSGAEDDATAVARPADLDIEDAAEDTKALADETASAEAAPAEAAPAEEKTATQTETKDTAAADTAEKETKADDKVTAATPEKAAPKEDVAQTTAEGTPEAAKETAEAAPAAEKKNTAADDALSAATAKDRGPTGYILSKDTEEESKEAMAELAKLKETLLQDVKPSQVGGRTVEELTRDMLKPMLKAWLDANLPSLVRWIVNEQVEKVIRQRDKDA